MATVIQIKRSSSTSAPATLKLGELALTYGTGTQGNLGDRLFIGEGGVDGNGDANNITVIGGQYFADLLDHVPGVLTSGGALIADSNKAIDEIILGSSTTVGGTIKFNEGSNNGAGHIGLKAPNSVTSTTTFTLPDGDGSAGEFIKTDGSGNLAFAVVDQALDLAGDTGTDTYNTSETLTFAGGTGMEAVVTDNTVTINATALVDSNFSGSAGISNSNLANPNLTLGSSTLTLGATETDLVGLTSLVIDDITIDGQSFTTTSANKNINISPHGTGSIIVPSGYEDRAGFQTQSLANKAYVDQVAQGLDTKPSCRLATIADLSATYNNGTLGVGATLTASSNGALSVDSVTPSVADRILVKEQLKVKYEIDLKKYMKRIYDYDFKFDVIVIDGQVRFDCIKPALEKIKDNGMIIYDNSDWHKSSKEELDKTDLIPIHFHGFKTMHVDSSTTSCYIGRKFNKKANHIIPMGGTIREHNSIDKSIL